MSKHFNFIFTCNSNYFLACECNQNGSVDLQCDSEGKCNCKENVLGDKCDEVLPGFYDITDPKGIVMWISICYVPLLHWKYVFIACACDLQGTECIQGIECNATGVEDKNISCDDNGKCKCRCNIKGDKCDVCNAEFWGYPHCHGNNNKCLGNSI